MCQGHDHPERLELIQKCIQALHCPTRWEIIDAIGSGEKSTKEIYEDLKLGEAGMTFAGLYYHLSALKRAGIIELASYREVKGGTPEKIWKLKTTKIIIDLLEEKDVK
ncbi:MAG: winged helix-turn-helix domain-containing protein [Methanotrichaceae archaeon]|nr:winged helix-turn-helix domain-containing protein [Methanotrichaceae archaeon]